MMRFMWSNWLRHDHVPPLQIGIEGLSAMTGSLEIAAHYVVTSEKDHVRSALVCNTLAALIASGRDGYLICRDPELWQNRLQQAGLLVDAANARARLHLLRWLPDTGLQLQHYGFRRFLTELEDLYPPADSLLILADADDWLQIADQQQLLGNIRHFARWLADWRLTCLSLLTSQSLKSPASPLLGQLNSFSGVAEFHQDLGCYHWLIKHWRSRGGTVVDADYEVHRRDDNSLLAMQPVVDDNLQGSAHQVYFTTASIDEDESLPSSWVACSQYQDVLTHIDDLGLATVVLHYRQPAAFQQLAQTVHLLRFRAGRQMRIVIRERGGQLRYSQELLLTRLGANQIVYMEFGVSRLLRSVESSLNQRFTGHIEEDFERALAAAMPSEECGYLPPARFCELVKATLHKTDTIEMHHVLVKLDLLPDRAHLDVLLNCQPRRANDVVTADEAHVYIFLFACREPDVDSALSRIIIEPLERMFSGQSYWSGRLNILDELEVLREKSLRNRLADFSLVLPANSPRQPIGAAEVDGKGSAKTSTLPRSSSLGISSNTAQRSVTPCVLKLRG